ncbi:MAG: hypothetical protein JSR87_10115 [Proteobacteria bacterium]|nr:hypothetical protein [Pseudomonadota bacterium]MBS0574246.1 hypothetical protein [Pseudomonadota bacterium]
MTEATMKASLRSNLQDILVLFQENQPTSLIADELVRSTSILDAMEHGGELEEAIREAEMQFHVEGFWKSSPKKLGHLVDRLRVDIQRAESREEKWSILVHKLIEAKADPSDEYRQ